MLHEPSLQKPIQKRFIYLTFFVGLLLQLLPIPRETALWLPDCIAILLLYWVIHQPNQIGIGTAVSLGLLIDLATANLLGQHALSYSIIVFLVARQQRRIHMQNLPMQALSILTLLLLSQIIMLMVRMSTGHQFVGLSYFIHPFIGALLWPLLIKLLLQPYRTHISV